MGRSTTVWIGALMGLWLAVCVGPVWADLITSPQRHVAEKRRLDAQRYQGGGFVSGATYELKGRMSGLVGSGGETSITLEVGDQTYYLTIPSALEGIRSGAMVRALVRVDGEGGALQVLSLVLDRDAAALDPDREPPVPPDNPREDAEERRQANAAESVQVDPDLAWHEYFTRLVQYFNPRLEDDKAARVAHNILYQSGRWQVDPFLIVAVIAAESRFNPTAVSRKGAMGLAQIMPSTARGMGLTNPYNVEQNIYAGVRTIKGHLERNRTGDPWEQFALALASYNAGSGAVRKYGGVPPYKETRAYINQVYSIYKSLRESVEG